MTTTIKMCMRRDVPQEYLTGRPVKVGDWLLLLSKSLKGTKARNDVWRIDHFTSGCRFSGRMFATQQECAEHVRDVTPRLSPKALAVASSWPTINDPKGVKFKEM